MVSQTAWFTRDQRLSLTIVQIACHLGYQCKMGFNAMIGKANSFTVVV